MWQKSVMANSGDGLSQGIALERKAEVKMPAVVALALGMMGAAVLVRWCVKEVQRVNAELDNVRASAAVEPVDRDALPTLKRDPETDEYRPG